MDKGLRILGLLLTFVVAFELQRQNKNIKDLMSQSENNHFEDINYQQNTREIMLDIANERS